MKLFEHQKKVLDETEDRTHVGYFLDMGLGKTFIGSEKMRQLDARVNFVICQKSKIKDWMEHFEKYYPDVAVFDFTNPKELKTFLLWANSTGKAKEIVCVGIINYELAWRRPELLKLKDFTLMLDESSLIQNRTAKQSKFILKLNPANVILLSGTPTSGKYENLWTQAKLLGWDIPVKTYEQQYVNFELLNIGGTQIKVVDRKNPYKNVERLKRKFRENGAVFMKTEECFELPEQNFIEVNVSKSREYKKFMKDSIITIDTKNKCEFHDDSDFFGKDVTPRVELVGDTTLTKLLYARQLCGAYSEDKLNAFRDLAQSTNDRLIVFYNFNNELDELKHICESLNKPISVVNGSEKNLDNYEACSDSVTLCQYQAAAMGLNLQKANKIVYFTLPLRSELYEQSKKRIHRIGQEQPCFYYILKCSNTVEDNILQTLNKRGDFTNELFRNEC